MREAVRNSDLPHLEGTTERSHPQTHQTLEVMLEVVTMMTTLMFPTTKMVKKSRTLRMIKMAIQVILTSFHSLRIRTALMLVTNLMTVLYGICWIEIKKADHHFPHSMYLGSQDRQGLME